MRCGFSVAIYFRFPSQHHHHCHRRRRLVHSNWWVFPRKDSKCAFPFNMTQLCTVDWNEHSFVDVCVCARWNPHQRVWVEVCHDTEIDPPSCEWTIGRIACRPRQLGAFIEYVHCSIDCRLKYLHTSIRSAFLKWAARECDNFRIEKGTCCWNERRTEGKAVLGIGNWKQFSQASGWNGAAADPAASLCDANVASKMIATRKTQSKDKRELISIAIAIKR